MRWWTSLSRDTSHRIAVAPISRATSESRRPSMSAMKTARGSAEANLVASARPMPRAAVVKALIPAPARFNQLLAGIPGISDRVLTERLRELETEGIVERLVDPGPPVRVSYRLTARGRALEPVLSAVSAWAESWLATAAAAVG